MVTQAGPLGLIVRSSGNFLNSTPQDEYSGWVYGGFAVPRAPEEAPVPQC